LTSSIPARDQSSGEVEAALWAGFAQASTREAFCASWLAIQCRIIGGVSVGAVLWKTTDSESFFPLAVWPSAQVNVSHLTEAAGRAARERRGLVLKRNLDGNNGDSELTRFEVAFPVEVAGHLYGVVVLDVPPRPEPQLQAVLRHLQWGFAWLEVMVRGEDARKDSSPAERLQTAVDFVATSAGQSDPDLKVDWKDAFGGFGSPLPSKAGVAVQHHRNLAEFSAPAPQKNGNRPKMLLDGVVKEYEKRFGALNVEGPTPQR